MEASRQQWVLWEWVKLLLSSACIQPFVCSGMQPGRRKLRRREKREEGGGEGSGKCPV